MMRGTVPLFLSKGNAMDRWQVHVRAQIDAAAQDIFRLLDIMTALSAMETQHLIPDDISIDLFDLISRHNT
jgi:hypothetical protein